MAKKIKTDLELGRDALALAPPRMTVLSDRPLRASETYLDSLNLAVKLGPIYDILRHPSTHTPLSVAVYGDWGTGKTSAMKWLEGLLLTWNTEGNHGEDVGKIVRPVWFYPWKYHHKEDVWRGLISEVIIASIDVRGATLGRIKRAVKDFGLFLGRSFLHALSSLELVSSTNVSALSDIYEEYTRVAHPEAGFLNEFETTLSKWVKETISDAGERMVIFIDDLDRCLPEVALQVLEALKLYLNIDDLIFVVGVDRVVIDQLLRELYSKLGLEPQKSRHYLAKMFQVEVVIAPTESQAETFIDVQLAAVGEHTNQYWITQLDDRERQMFRSVVLRLAQRNPRELKRLLNSVLIHGAGVLHVHNRPFSFAQGMQVFLVRRILEERYTMGLSLDTKAGMSFFHQWSRLVRSGAPQTVLRPDELAEALASGSSGDDAAGHGRGLAWGLDYQDPAEARRNPYAELVVQSRFAHLRHLLADADLGELMQIEYPADTTVLAASSRTELPHGLLREAVARQLGKSPSELKPGDYYHLAQLDLEGQEIADLSALQVCTGLKNLALSFTQVSNLTPLESLTQLESLALASTPVADIKPLEHMVQLTALSLANTKVQDLGPLRGLTRLQSLVLRGMKIVDISPLAGLVQLATLSLASTPVADLAPLAGLGRLKSLSLVSTEVVDLAPLGALYELTALHVSCTRVSDLGPLAELRRLESLSLMSTPVADLAPLHGLSSLRVLDVRQTHVDAKAVSALKQALPGLEIRL